MCSIASTIIDVSQYTFEICMSVDRVEHLGDPDLSAYCKNWDLAISKVEVIAKHRTWHHARYGDKLVRDLLMLEC